MERMMSSNENILKSLNKSEEPVDVKIQKSDAERKERMEKAKEYMSSLTETNIESLESILADKNAKQEVARLVEEFRSINNSNSRHMSEEDRTGKKFKLANGEEVLIGDLILLNLFNNSNVSRGTDGKLQIIDPKTKNKKSFVMTEMVKRTKSPFNFVYLHTEKNKDKKSKVYPTSFAYWMKASPNAIRKGILRKDDFPVRLSNTTNYEMYGAHERKISKSKPTAYFSNENGQAQYYLGREKFVGTNVNINHDTVSVLLLDNNTAGVVNSTHGKKEILFTFPLISKNEYKSKREVVVNKLEAKGRDTNEKI